MKLNYLTNRVTFLFLSTYAASIVLRVIYGRTVGFDLVTASRITVIVSLYVGVFLFYTGILYFLLKAKVKFSLLPIEKILVYFFLLNIFWTILGLVNSYPVRYVAGDSFRLAFLPLAAYVTYNTFKNKDTHHLMYLLWTMFITCLLINKICHIASIATIEDILLMAIVLSVPTEKGKIYTLLKWMLIIFLLNTVGSLSIILSMSGMLFLVLMLKLAARPSRSIKPVHISLSIMLLFVFVLGIGHTDRVVSRMIPGVYRRVGTHFGSEGYLGFMGDSPYHRIVEVKATIQNLNMWNCVLGHGNGALIEFEKTPVTRWLEKLYGTSQIHNIHSTPFALLYRNGLVSLLLYMALFVCLNRIFFRDIIRRRSDFDKTEMVILTAMVLFNFGALIHSVTAFHYFGDLYVGISIGMIIVILRKNREKRFCRCKEARGHNEL